MVRSIIPKKARKSRFASLWYYATLMALDSTAIGKCSVAAVICPDELKIITCLPQCDPENSHGIVVTNEAVWSSRRKGCEIFSASADDKIDNTAEIIPFCISVLRRKSFIGV